MSRREAWDPVSEQTYTPRGRVRRRPVLGGPFRHTCPDGTRVVVTGQYIEMTNVTLYRWWINGVLADPTSAPGDKRNVPPDWSAIDRRHSVAA